MALRGSDRGSKWLPRDECVFVWKPDLLIYFQLDETLPQAAQNQPEKPVKTGRPLKHDWVFLTLQASLLIRNNLEINQARLIKRFWGTLIKLGKEVPADNALQDLFKQVLTFEKTHKKQRR